MWAILAPSFGRLSTIQGIPVSPRSPPPAARNRRRCAPSAATRASPGGLYAGAACTADADGSLDAALVLRTVFQRGGPSRLRAGAGVMGQSTPQREREETCEKLRSVAPHLRCGPDTPPAEPP
ncbi:chorismate-binding protein [Streptomyces coeruleorubidus]|uniref:chorismate-binding protein n=1 Tax=Streptomyces coeruleorubidus TaxID=116188 RepID=UPI0027E5B811|nr:chorismate-binding protein [Streptomyces bellus]